MSELSRLAGIIYPEVLQVEDLVVPMLDVMKTGISGESFTHTSKNFQLGSVGSELAFNEKKTMFAALDGRIENLPELKRALKSNGISINLEDPAPILLAAYSVWKEDFIQKVEGVFAIAIFDSEKGELFLARDRIGVKPLYWYQDNRHFIFGSELKSLLATGIVPQTADSDALAMYLYFGFIPQDLSPIKEVNKLLPGHYLLHQVNKGRVIRPYWSYSSYFSRPLKEKPNEILLNISDLLSNSTQELLPEKKETIGCFITGGIGSATVAMEVSDQAPPNQTRGFSVCFEGENEEDLAVANIIATTLDIPQISSTLPSSALLDHLVSIVWNLDEPLADPTIVTTWKLCELAANETNTVFSGMGSDEFLAGHNRYTNREQAISYMSRMNLIPNSIIRNVLIPVTKFIYPKAAFKILKVARTNPWQFEFLRHNAVFDQTTLKLIAPKLADYFDPDVFLHKFHHLSHIPSGVSSLVYIDVKTRLPDHFILLYERLTKAHGLAWRCPFLNKKLIEYTAALPEPKVLAEDEAASYLKPLIDPVFPENIVNRPKKSRYNMLNSWAEHPEIKAVFQYLKKGTLVETGIISEDWMNEQLSPTRTNKDNFRNLWPILVLEVWFHLYINHPIRPRLATTNLHELLSEP